VKTTGVSATRVGDPQAERPSRVGLLAGWGDYPLVVAEALKKQGRSVCCLGVIGHADPRLAELCDEFHFSGLARFGSAIRFFKQRKITEMTMAGKIFKVRLFRRFGWLRHLPDLRTVRMFFHHFWTRNKDCKDDTLLRAIVDEFAREGINFRPATDYAPQLLAGRGAITRDGPSENQWKDIRFAWRVAKELGRLDIGQSVAVKNRTVLAVEAIEGTDACIRRAGELCTAGGFVVVKTAKPQQDMRFDVPTVGLGTLQTMLESGAAALAVEAERTIILDEAELIESADRNRIVIVALRHPGDNSIDDSSPAAAA